LRPLVDTTNLESKIR